MGLNQADCKCYLTLTLSLAHALSIGGSQVQVKPQRRVVCTSHCPFAQNTYKCNLHCTLWQQKNLNFGIGTGVIISHVKGEKSVAAYNYTKKRVQLCATSWTCANCTTVPPLYRGEPSRTQQPLSSKHAFLT